MSATRRRRRSALAILLASAASLSLFGCSEEAPLGLDPGDGPMTAFIDGVPFTALLASANIVNGQVFVNGAGDNQTAIGFQFPDTGPDTYLIEVGNPVAAGVTEGSDSWAAGSGFGSGSIVVQVLTASRVEGTFSFTAEASGGSSGTRSVTQGSFAIDF